jgi:hypothetical protein
MRYQNSITLILFVLASCGSEETTDKSTNTPIVNPVNESDSSTAEEDFYVPEDPITRAYGIEEMPSEWFMLTDDEDGLSIYDHWESQGERIFFVPEKGDDWFLEIYHAQDTEQGLISEFHSEITEGEGIHKVEGSFNFFSQFRDTTVTVKFTWDQMARLGEFQNTGLASDYFVPAESKDFYPEVVIEREPD